MATCRGFSSTPLALPGGCCWRPAAYLEALVERRTQPTTSACRWRGLRLGPENGRGREQGPLQAMPALRPLGVPRRVLELWRGPLRRMCSRRTGGVAGAAGPGHQQANLYQNHRSGISRKRGFPQLRPVGAVRQLPSQADGRPGSWRTASTGHTEPRRANAGTILHWLRHGPEIRPEILRQLRYEELSRVGNPRAPLNPAVRFCCWVGTSSFSCRGPGGSVT